jgi:hypothetical protein
VQRDLEADLMRGTRTRLLAPSTVPPASDSTEAMEAARRLGASIVVFGQMQSNGSEIRLTGQVVDVATERPLGPMKATGLMSDLFHLEDAIAGQALSLLPKELLNQEALSAATNNQPTSPAAPVQTSPSQTAVTDLGPTTTYQPPATTYTSTTDSTYEPPPTQSSYQYPPAGTDSYSGYIGVPAYTYGSACPVPVYTFPTFPCVNWGWGWGWGWGGWGWGWGWGFPACGVGSFGVVISPFGGFDHHHDFNHGFDHPDHGHWQDHGSFNHGFENHPGSTSFAAGGRNPSTPGVNPRVFNSPSAAGPRMNPAVTNRGFASPAARGGFAPSAARTAPQISTFSGNSFHGGASTFHGGMSGQSFGGAFHSGGFHPSSGGFHGGSGGFHGGFGGAHAGGGRR